MSDTVWNVSLLAVSFFTLGYLLYTLLYPERF